MHAHEVVAVDLAGKRDTIITISDQPSGLGWLPDGRLLIVSMRDRKLLCLEKAGLTVAADLSTLTPYQCNDIVVDTKGRAYIGNFGFELGQEDPKTTSLIMVTPDGKALSVADDLFFPNGMVIAPDGKTLIVAETFGRCLTAFDINPDGSLGSRRTWAQVDSIVDGICLDAEGCIWVAVPTFEWPLDSAAETYRPGGFIRVAEGGEIRERLELSDRGGIACMLGGPDRRTLFMLEAFTHVPERTSPGNGRIRTVEVSVSGAGLP
jgi:sugar lactone lactonase YvrE